MVALAIALALQWPAAAQAPSPISQAERRLFVDDHLRDVHAPTTLHYAFVKTGTLEPGRRDELSVMLRPGGDGRCCVASGGFAGEQEAPLPQIEDAKANPVVLHFLERDVREMRRLTGGQPNYFRKRLRLSLADAATLKDTMVRYRGQMLPAVELRVTPYADDPMRGRYERFAAKQYVFVLADGVPGGVVELRSSVPGPTADGAPLLQETLTLQDDK
ncbi:MAG TPA: hypothetical protein VGQ23_08035 [Burkholderiaceae bacterium]|nr:hypothetical protein [Burkholderiaceae bacterium]